MAVPLRNCTPFLKRQPGERGAAVLSLSLRLCLFGGALLPRAPLDGGGSGGVGSGGESGELTGGALLQWNCNGIQSSRTELSENLSSKGIMVLVCRRVNSPQLVHIPTSPAATLPSDVTAQKDVVVGAF